MFVQRIENELDRFFKRLEPFGIVVLLRSRTREGVLCDDHVDFVLLNINTIALFRGENGIDELVQFVKYGLVAGEAWRDC